MKYHHQSEELRAPSTGQLIDQALREKGLPMLELARRMDRKDSTIRPYLTKDSIQTAILWEICHALKRNFFADIAAMLPEDYRSESADHTRAQLEALKKERDLLLQAISGRG